MTEVILLRRGDDEQLILTGILDDDGEMYERHPGDYLKLTIRERPSDCSPILLEAVTYTDVFTLTSEMTERIQPGMYSGEILLHSMQPDGTYLHKRIFPDDEYIEEYGRTGGERNWKNVIVNAKVGLNDD